MVIKNNVNIRRSGKERDWYRTSYQTCTLEGKNINQFMQRLSDRGLIWVDAGVSIHLPLSLDRGERFF